MSGYLSNKPGEDLPLDQQIALEQLADLGDPLQHLRVNALGLGLEYADPPAGLSIGDTIGSATEGSIFFGGPLGVLAQDNDNLFWDNTNKDFIVGGNTTFGSRFNVSATDGDLMTLGGLTGGAGKQRFLAFQDGTNVQWRVNIQGDNSTRDISGNPSYSLAMDSRSGGTGFSIFRWPATSGSFQQLFGLNETEFRVLNTSGDTRLYINQSTGNTGMGGEGSPVNTVDILGEMVVGSSFSGVETAASDGIGIEGFAGFGIATALAPIHVQSNSFTRMLVENNSGTDLFTVTGGANSGGRIAVGNGSAGELEIIGDSSTGDSVVNNSNTIGGDWSLQNRGVHTMKLHVGQQVDFNGGVVIGSSYFDVETPPTDGLLIEGDTSIGTASTFGKGDTKLTVSGDNSTGIGTAGNYGSLALRNPSDSGGATHGSLDFYGNNVLFASMRSKPISGGAGGTGNIDFYCLVSGVETKRFSIPGSGDFLMPSLTLSTRVSGAVSELLTLLNDSTSIGSNTEISFEGADVNGTIIETIRIEGDKINNLDDAVIGDAVIYTNPGGILATETARFTGGKEFHMLGGAVFGSSFANVETPPTDGALFEGHVAIGGTNDLGVLTLETDVDNARATSLFINGTGSGANTGGSIEANWGQYISFPFQNVSTQPILLQTGDALYNMGSTGNIRISDISGTTPGLTYADNNAGVVFSQNSGTAGFFTLQAGGSVKINTFGDSGFEDRVTVLGGGGASAGNVGLGTGSPTAQLHTTKGRIKACVAKTATYTITIEDHIINCTANSFTVTLPTAVGITGQEFIIKNSGVGTITLDGDGTETIDGSLTVILPAGRDFAYTVMSTGSNWIII